MDWSWHLNKDRIDKEMLINQHEYKYFLLMLQVVQISKKFEDSIAKWSKKAYRHQKMMITQPD